MKCFHHHDADAIGVCKACNKGLCPECAAEVGLSLACKDTCTEEVALLDEQVKRARLLQAAQRRNRMFMPSLFFVLGVSLIAMTWFETHRLGFGSFPGFAFIVYGVILLLINRRWLREMEAINDESK